MAKGDKEPLPIYESQPPKWLPQSHTTSDLGYVGFYPPRPDQEEEILTEANVKNGLILGMSVPAEVHSGKGNFYGALASIDVLSDLEDVMNRIFNRKAEGVPPISPSTFRLPSRVTLNDAKRQAWFADLANPEVPLHKLSKSVPHGAKGHDLLDLLHTNNVAIPRAVWFLRVFGGNETAGLRNRPGYNPTQYSVEWANVVTGYMKKQLADIALPMAPRPGLNIKQTFKGKLSDAEGRERWISRFTYCLSLLRSFYSEGMVDNRTFLAWLVQQVGTCNLAQLGFVSRLADDYLDGMLVCRALTRPFAEACLNRLVEVYASSAREHLVTTEKTLKSLILRAFLALPDAFVNPRNWVQHGDSIADLLRENIEGGPLAEPTTQGLRQLFLDSFADVETRNEALLFRDLPPRVSGSLSSALSDIKLLNSLSGKTDMETIGFFDAASDEPADFAPKLDILLTWSVTPLQYGDHRPYAATGLLRCWWEKAGERAIRRDRASPDEFLQDQLFDWLDTCDIAAEPSNLPNVALLFGQLVHHGLFSYEQYIQRLIARGEPGLAFSQENGSRHRDFLRWIPLHSSSAALNSQRRVALYGVRARETPEEPNEREIRREIRELLPELFGGDIVPMTTFTDGLESSCSTLYSAPRYEQVRVVRAWLLPILKKAISSHTDGSLGLSDPVLKAYCVSAVMMAHCKCYGVILDLSLFTLQHATSIELLTAVIETMRQHMEVWACLNAMKSVTAALFSAHQYWKARGIQNRNLLNLLADADNGRFLEQSARDQVIADKLAYTHALHPVNENPDIVPVALPEILLLATDPNIEAPSILANSLWYKYRTAGDWAWKVWDNTIASLRQIPSMIVDLDGRRACALRYGAFLVHVDQHLAAGLDDQILTWFLGSGRNEVAALTAEAWNVVIVVLLYLSIHGALSTTTILEGLVYPVWQMGASVVKTEHLSTFEVLLTAVNDLCTRLLLSRECGGDYPPSNFFEARGLLTRRRDVYREPYFASLVQHIPTLVLVEQNANLTDALRQASASLRESICRAKVFRQGIYRDLDTVHRAFETLLERQDVSGELHERLVNALRLMLNDGYEGRDGGEPGSDWQALSTFLSPWKLAATSLEMRFSLKQLDTSLGREATRAKALAYLNRLTSVVLRQGISSEQGDFVAEMLKDVSVAIAGKFVNAGLQRIHEVLAEPGIANVEDTGFVVPSAGEVLRMVANIVGRFRDNAASMPQLEAQVQDTLMGTISIKLTATIELLASETIGPSTGVNLPQVSQTTIFLARLIQFVLSFPGVWSPTFKSQSEPLCNNLVKLALLYGSGTTLDPVTSPLLLDTLCYILDELPPESKTSAFDPFRLYPQITMQSLPRDMPMEYRRRIRTLLPFVDLNPAVDGLALASKDASGEYTNFQPVQNRPWEWTENLGDHSPLDSRTEEKPDARNPIKNMASLPLELFSARATGERIIEQDESDDDPRIEGNLRMLQEGLSGESIFQRDWRESRISLESPDSPRAENEDQVGPLPAFPTTTHSQTVTDRRSSSRKPSPASSVRSRGSAQGLAQASVAGGSSLRQSPFLNRFSGSTAGDPIDVDSLDVVSTTTHSTSAKRKAIASAVDDEVEVVEGPVQSKRTKGKTTARSKAGKKK